MTYDEAQEYIRANKSKINDEVSGYKFLGLVTATNTADTRRKEQIFKEVQHKGTDNKAELRLSGELNSDLNVFFVGQLPNGNPVVLAFSDYLQAISEKRS